MGPQHSHLAANKILCSDGSSSINPAHQQIDTIPSILTQYCYTLFLPIEARYILQTSCR